VFYIAIQLAVNIGTYRHSRIFGLALNGRYILPGLLPLIGLGWFYWSKLLHKRPKTQVVLAIGIVLFTILGSGILMMLHNPQLRTG
jgi:chromate transport protein ChrA